MCYVDAASGYVVNVRQGTNASCTVGGTQVVIPSTGKYMTKVEMSMDKEVPFVGRLAFHLRDTLTAKPVVHTCGWAGGDAVSLFPPNNVVWRIDIGCMPVTPVALGRRRTLLQMQNGTRYAVNPGLVNPRVVSSAVVAAASTSTTAPLAAATTPTGEVKSPPVQVNILVPAVADAVFSIANEPPACSAGECTTPFSSSPPGAPGIGAVSSPSANTLVVPFTASSPAGEPPVAAYTVVCLPYTGSSPPTAGCPTNVTGAVTQTVPAGASPLQATLTGLASGSTWVCSVTANNGVGGDVCSAPSAPVTVIGAPSAPGIGEKEREREGAGGLGRGGLPLCSSALTPPLPVTRHPHLVRPRPAHRALHPAHRSGVARNHIGHCGVRRVLRRVAVVHVNRTWRLHRDRVDDRDPAGGCVHGAAGGFLYLFCWGDKRGRLCLQHCIVSYSCHWSAVSAHNRDGHVPCRQHDLRPVHGTRSRVPSAWATRPLRAIP